MAYVKENHQMSNLSASMNRILGTVLLAVVVCGAAACLGPRKSASQRLADRALVESVQGALSDDTLLYSRHITVRADNGVVTLDGYTWTPEELQAAVQDAQQVSGVTKVVNRIEVDRGAISNSSSTR